MKLTKLINIADKAYPDGLVGLYYRNPHRTHGDGMARFIATELSETFDPEETDLQQLERATHLLRVATRECEAVADALQEAFNKLSD